MKVYSDAVVVACTKCGEWEGPIVEAYHVESDNPDPNVRIYYACPKCGNPLAVRLDGEYTLRQQTDITRMTADGLSDLDLAKLLFRQIEHHHLISGLRGKAFENKLLEAALRLVKYPRGFDLNTFTAQQLLDEERRRTELDKKTKSA